MFVLPDPSHHPNVAQSFHSTEKQPSLALSGLRAGVHTHPAPLSQLC